MVRHCASIVLLTVFLAHAQPAPNTNRSAAISDVRMRSLLQGMGVDFTESSSGDSTVFAFPLNGRVVTLLNQVKSMQLSACVQNPFDPMKANQWNQVHFSTGVRLDQQGCAALRSDVHFGDGPTDGMIEAFISDFCTDVTISAKFLTSPPSADRSASPIATMAWTQVGQRAKYGAPWSDATKPAVGLLQILRNVSLKYDPDRWKPTTSPDEGEFALSYSSGDGHALVIAERMVVPLDAIPDIALANAQSADPNAKVVFRNKRKVNGVVLYVLKIEVTVDTVPVVYSGYFYAGESGTVQVVTYTPKTLLPEYEKDFMDFLNGFTVSK
jgi:hypothetical protein